MTTHSEDRLAYLEEKYKRLRKAWKGAEDEVDQLQSMLDEIAAILDTDETYNQKVIEIQAVLNGP